MLFSFWGVLTSWCSHQEQRCPLLPLHITKRKESSWSCWTVNGDKTSPVDPRSSDAHSRSCLAEPLQTWPSLQGCYQKLCPMSGKVTSAAGCTGPQGDSQLPAPWCPFQRAISQGCPLFRGAVLLLVTERTEKKQRQGCEIKQDEMWCF